MSFFEMQICGSLSKPIVEFTGVTPNVGEFYSLNDGRGGPLQCGVVTGEVSSGPSSFTAVTQYNSCMDCITGTSLNNFFVFSNCVDRKTIFIDPTDWGFLPSNGDVFEIDCTFNGSPIVSCFTFNTVSYSNIGPPTTAVLNSQTSYSLCTLCLWETNSVIVEVEECGTTDLFYVQVPTTAGPFISFIEDGNPNQRCGTIITTADTLTNATYISSFDGCTECLTQVNIKREIINCITGEIDVIYASALYGVGEAGYVTIINAEEGESNCYRIGELTDSEVTITSYLLYQPSSSCDECVACNGYGILFYECNDEGQFIYSGLSYQYVMTGQTFLHPVLGCCYVDRYYDPILGYDETLWSFYEFEGCTECETNQTGYESWYAESCNDNGVLFSGAISLPIGYNIGDTLTVKLGLYNYICVELLNPFGEDRYTAIAISDGTTYSDCPTCYNQQYIGVTIINCKTLEEKNVLMYQWAYDMILKNGPYFNDFYQNCYYIFGDCVKDESLPLFIPGLLYASCDDCHAPKSANTPSTVCEICCDCGATGSTVNIITPPYPVWTDQYGKAVVQTNMIVIGGNGLNG